MRKINLGCGPYPQKGFINIDINPRHNPDIVRDVSKGLPFDSSSVDEVRADHFLEHLYREDLMDLIAEIYRVLIPNGVFRFIVPLGGEWEIDHIQSFNEKSFDIIMLEENADYFQRNFKWKDLVKKITTNDRGTVMRASMVAVK